MNEMRKEESLHERTACHEDDLKKNMIARLNRIEGQIRGISRMIGEDVYCDDILHQVSSVESAIHGVKKVLLEAHLRSCIVNQIREGNDEVIDELLVTLGKIIK